MDIASQTYEKPTELLIRELEKSVNSQKAIYYAALRPQTGRHHPCFLLRVFG
jgi:hypothetical protein